MDQHQLFQIKLKNSYKMVILWANVQCLITHYVNVTLNQNFYSI